MLLYNYNTVYEKTITEFEKRWNFYFEKNFLGKEVIKTRTFLQATLDLIKDSKKENCEDIRNNVNNGIATYLSSKYKDYFEDIPEFRREEADDFYKEYVEEFDRYERKYGCKGDEGLHLMLSVAFNKLY